MTRCLRCADPFERRTVDQVHCLRCALEVAAILEADAKRRTGRWPAKDLTGLAGLVL